jgi:hypothetical protein
MLRQLTQSEVDALPTGSWVWITWSGGNGPHRYETYRANGLVYAVADDSHALLFAIDFVGKYPLTQVWIDDEEGKAAAGKSDRPAGQ